MSTAPIEQAIGDLADEFATLSDWEERYGYLLDLGRALAPLSDSERTDAAKVRGCASQVWLVFERPPAAPGRVFFRGDSDAHLVRGLIAVLVRLFSGRTAGEIRSVDSRSAFARLGFADALTPQRSNGLYAMMQRIRAEAEAA